MTELLLIYLALGALAALAEGRRRLSVFVRTMLIWPTRIPALIKADPSPHDEISDVGVWTDKIQAAVQSLTSAIEGTEALEDGRAGQRLLMDTSTDLQQIAQRHVELERVLQRPENSLRQIRQAKGQVSDHRLPVLARREDHILRLYRAREALESRMEAGLSEVMNLAARLHLSRATGAPVSSLDARLADISRVVDGVMEAEEVFGPALDEDVPEGWQPTLLELDAEVAESPPLAPPASEEPQLQPQPETAPLSPRPVLEADPEFEEVLQELFSDPDVQLPTVVAEPRDRVWDMHTLLGVNEDKLLPFRRWSAFVIGILTAASLLVRLLYMSGLEQTSLLFIGLPGMLALLLVLLPAPKSITGFLLKLTTLLLLLSGVLLAEGLICILMAAPLFYLVVLSTGLILDAIRTHKRTTKMVVLAPVVMMSLEGLSPVLSLEREETVSATQVLDMGSEDVFHALSLKPHFDSALPIYLRMGFPRPVGAAGAGLAIGDRRLIKFAGGEGKPGDLVLSVESVADGHVRFLALSDTSHINHWLTWRGAEVHWEALDSGQTQVTWTLHYNRDLDPMWWFGPTERYAAKLTANYLIDALIVAPLETR